MVPRVRQARGDSAYVGRSFTEEAGVSEINPRDLNDEIYARWQRFYRKGLIDRRTLLQAAMVWAGATSVGALAACGGDDDGDSGA